MTCSEESKLIVSDPQTGQPIHKVSLREGKHRFRTSDASFGIGSLAIFQSNTLCVVGGVSNGGVRVVNLRSGLIIAALDNHHDPSATVEVAVYEPSSTVTGGVALIISTGTDGRICLYDAVSYKLRASMQHPVSFEYGFSLFCQQRGLSVIDVVSRSVMPGCYHNNGGTLATQLAHHWISRQDPHYLGPKNWRSTPYSPRAS